MMAPAIQAWFGEDAVWGIEIEMVLLRMSKCVNLKLGSDC